MSRTLARRRGLWVYHSCPWLTSTIGREDLSPRPRVASRQRGVAGGRGTGPPTRRALLSVLGRYIQFNSAFGPGLANLAGEIAARQGLFRDADEPVRILADRAAEVGADFFYAAVDEFDDRATPWRDTHRTLAQATVKGMGALLRLRSPGSSTT